MPFLTTAISYATSTAVLCTASLVAGVLFSQKIKDWVSGTSAEFRSAMASVEAKAKADVKAAVADVFSKIVPVPPPAPAPAPPAPEAPHA
jgi:hypothetical protein